MTQWRKRTDLVVGILTQVPAQIVNREEDAATAPTVSDLPSPNQAVDLTLLQARDLREVSRAEQYIPYVRSGEELFSSQTKHGRATTKYTMRFSREDSHEVSIDA